MRNQTNTSQDDFLTLRFWQICSHSHSADNRRLHCRLGREAGIVSVHVRLLSTSGVGKTSEDPFSGTTQKLKGSSNQLRKQ